MTDGERGLRPRPLRACAVLLAATVLPVSVHGGAGVAHAGEEEDAGGASAEPVQAAGTDPATVEVRRAVHLMGTRLEGRARAPDRESGLAALEAAFGAVEAEEELLSTWRAGTATARLNASPPGTAVEVPARLHRLLEEAWRIARATGGAFDPAVGALVDAWDLRGEGRLPSRSDLASARRASGTGCFELGSGRRITPRCPGAWIDAGAFGKGSALRRARQALEETRQERRGADGAAGRDADDAVAVLLDFGGQLLAVGAPPDREAWRAGVAHPVRRDRPVARLALRDRSAATTSASERFVTVGGEARGHVLDPRTGRPAPAWGSVTVVAADPMLADALSTALFVMGPEEGWRWARDREDVGVLLLAPEDPAAGGRNPRDGTGRPGAPDDTPPGAGVAACWNAAMEAYLTEVPGPRRCAGDERTSES